MSQRVLSTDRAKSAARQMSILLNGPLATQLAALKQQGQALCSPLVWDGPMAAQFRTQQWPPMGRSMDQVLQALASLQRSSQTVVESIMAAGTQGNLAGGKPGINTDLWLALEGLVLPPSSLGAAGIGMWGLGQGLTIFGGVESWMTYVKLGRFAPRNALGQFVSPEDLPWWKTAWKSMSDKSWIARSGMADTRDAWSTAGDWAGRAGGVVAIGTAALSQWMQDSGNSHLDTNARIGRTAYAGLVSGGAAWAGAIGGAELGGAIGSVFPGPGTAIGAIIGGIAGGVVGSGVGTFVVDHTVDAIGHAADSVGHAFGDVGHALASINPF